MKAGDSIATTNAGWKFDKNVAENFDSHARRSIPMYEQGHQLVCDISDFFLQDNSTCYELGTSTGELIEKIAQHNKHKQVNYIAIDNQPAMIEKARNRCKANDKIKIENEDINLYDFDSSDLIVSYYCVQFIPPKFRQQLFNKIYQSLNWGGAFILFEKVRGADARFHDILTSLYTEFKLSQNYTPEEIVAKSRSLKGVLEPFSRQGNVELMQRAGFKDIETIMKFTSFEGFLAIK